MAVPKPDYLSRDYTGLRQSLLDFGVQSASDRNIDWNPASEGDFGLLLVEMFAYMGDILSYNTDRAQMENYLATATQRESVLGLAYMLGYVPNSGSAASGTVTLTTDANSTIDGKVPAGTVIATGRIEAIDGPVKFEVAANTLTSDGSWVIPKGAASTVTVPVVEGQTVRKVEVGESTGQPNQSFLLPNTGVYAGTVQVEVAGVSWTRVDHLLDADPRDRVFEVVAAGDTSLIVFGDDINGAIPPTGLTVLATYRHGVGANGNVLAGQVYLISDTNLGGVHVARNTAGAYMSTDMTGGADPESTESVRYNAPRAYRTQSRAVTKNDFRDLALSVEGVTKANVVSGSFTSVTVYVTGPDGNEPGTTLKNLVRRRLSSRVLAGTSVTVSSPTLVWVNVGTATNPVRVEIWDQFSKSAVDTEVRKAVKEYVSRLAFGEKISVGRLYEVISSVNGVRYVDIDAMVRDDVANQTGTVTLTPRPWEVFRTDDDHITLSIIGGAA